MIGYLGPSGTFSHTAALSYFQGSTQELREYPTIYSLLKAADSGKVEKAIVPIENSIEGSVTITLDTLAFDTDLHITGEYVLKVQQNLLVKPGTKREDIKQIVSIDQAIGQCSRLLNNEFEQAQIQFCESTAKAAQLVAAGDGTLACICSENCAKLYGLEILISDCGDEDNNTTRFVIVEKQASLQVTDHDKSSIAFVADNRPGSLYSVLELLAKSKINMVKIESRPVKTELGEYVFFIDVDGNVDNPTVYFALDKVRRSTSFYKFLGSYEACK